MWRENFRHQTDLLISRYIPPSLQTKPRQLCSDIQQITLSTEAGGSGLYIIHLYPDLGLWDRVPWCQDVSSTKTNCPGPDILDMPLGHTKYYTLLWQSYTIRLLPRPKTIAHWSKNTPNDKNIRCLGAWIFTQENGTIKENEIVDQKYWNLPIEFLEVAPSAPSPLEEAGLASRHFWYLWK